MALHASTHCTAIHQLADAAAKVNRFPEAVSSSPQVVVLAAHTPSPLAHKLNSSMLSSLEGLEDRHKLAGMQKAEDRTSWGLAWHDETVGL